MQENVMSSIVAGLGMIIVAVWFVVWWRKAFHARYRWFWVGAAVWVVGVGLKFLFAIFANGPILTLLAAKLPYRWYVAAGGMAIGMESSLFEMGITLCAVLIWRSMGRDAERSIAVGIGAGSFEAAVIALAALGAIIGFLSGVPGLQVVGSQIDKTAATTPVFWLVAPAERAIAILCHAGTRALVLLGVTQRKPLMALGGFVLFALLDGVVGEAHLAGRVGNISMWWIELSLLPFALASILILRWCVDRWGREGRQAPHGAPPLRLS